MDLDPLGLDGFGQLVFSQIGMTGIWQPTCRFEDFQRWASCSLAGHRTRRIGQNRIETICERCGIPLGTPN
jgi:hypothetical protein